LKLLVVESPNKAKTIQGYLEKMERGKWLVLSTKGHILDLPENELGLEFGDNDVRAKWLYIKGKKKVVDAIAEAARKAEEVFIATDDDREGEKIAKDVVDRAKIGRYKRITLHEITPKELRKKLVEGARPIDSKVTATAICRRMIDRDVGYPISQIVKYDMKRSGSRFEPRGVGRVISPALHILVERELQIEAFVPEEYKQIRLEYVKDGVHFKATNMLRFTREQEKELNEMLFLLRQEPHIVHNYKQKTADVEPKKPLITSTMQYGAWYLFGMDPKTTMKTAQSLFEKGLITYHRTDSYKISMEAHLEMMELLDEVFGQEYVLSQPRKYKNRPSAQAAHEAIRPTLFTKERFPRYIRESFPDLTEQERRLYEFIWLRTLATRMKDAVYDVSEVEISIGGNIFKAKAHRQLFDGWERLEGRLLKISDRDDDDWKDDTVVLPGFIIGEELVPHNISLYEGKTVRPDRYGVGRFITTLDNLGIARPSTLDTIIDSLVRKEYVVIRSGMLYPTEAGKEVDNWVSENAAWLNSVEHAKEFEERLDAIEKGEEGMAMDLVLEYHGLVEELAQRIGYVFRDKDAPTASQIDLIEKIAREKGIEVGEEVFANRKLAEAFLKAHVKKREKLFRCPACREGEVYEGEKNYYCGAKCGFVLWKNGIERFFENVGLGDLPAERKMEIVKRSGTTKPVLATGLRGRSGKEFDAKIVLKKDERYGWQLAFSFTKKKK